MFKYETDLFFFTSLGKMGLRTQISMIRRVCAGYHVGETAIRLKSFAPAQ